MLADKTNVVKRSSKGTPLTYVEMDRNFSELVNAIDDVDALTTDVNTLTTTVDEFVTDVSDPAVGSTLVGFTRSTLANTITTVNMMLSGITVNIWEFANYVTSKPTSSPSTWDWTPATAAASAYVKSQGGGWVRYPAGSYPHTKMVKQHGVSWMGDGSSVTYITTLASTSAVPYGLIEVEAGAVSSSHMIGMHVMGSAVAGFAQATVNATQWGMYAKAQWDATYQHGGLWYSEFRDVRFSNFNYGVWTRGGYTINNYKRPIQFVTFDKVFIQVPTGGEALRMTGQHGQIEFRGGSAEGRDGVVAALCINIGMDPDPSTMADNAATGHGENTSDAPGTGNAVQAPYNVNFANGFSIQKSRKGIAAKNCRQISVQGAWVEGIAELIDLSTNAHLTFESNHLANAADGSIGGVAGTGYFIKMATSSALEFKSTSDVIGTVDNYLEPTTNLNNLRSLKIEGLAFGDTYQKFVAAGYKTMVLTGSAIDIGAHKFVVINPAPGDPSLKLDILKATIAPGERVTIRALTGPITVVNTGNISLNGEPAICLPLSGAMVLERLYQVIGNVEWVLISVTEQRATAAPTDGFYYPQAHRVWRRDAAASGPMGWICTTAGLAGSTAVFKAMPNLAA
jgi:hypothetical protein